MKRTWTVHVPGRDPFQAVFMEGEIDADQAQREVRLIWPLATVS